MVEEKIKGIIGIAKHYLGLANKEEVTSAELLNRKTICDSCPKKNKAYFGVDTCGVCGCPLFQKLPLLYDPKLSEIKGELVLNKCPDQDGSKW